jgi:hypothetical protein
MGVELVDVIPLLHVCVCCNLPLSLMIWTTPVDVGDLLNHVKYYASVLSL